MLQGVTRKLEKLYSSGIWVVKSWRKTWDEHVARIEALSENMRNQESFIYCYFHGVVWEWVYLVCRPLIGLLYQTRMIDEYGAFCGMRIGRGDRNTRKKPLPVPLCPPQILHDLTWDRTWAAAVGSRRLTAWAMARPSGEVNRPIKSILKNKDVSHKVQWQVIRIR
jgi:hypothetical protein